MSEVVLGWKTCVDAFICFFFFRVNIYTCSNNIQECEDLITKGITGTGEGFDLPGRRLGGFSHRPPISSLRTTALAAAEKRAKLESLLPSGPKRLGGGNAVMVGLSPVQAAAMAAERRLQDDIWCGSASCEASEDGEGSSDKLHDIIHTEQSAGVLGLDSISRKRSRESNIDSSFQTSNSHLKSNFLDLSMDASESNSMLDPNMRSQQQSRVSDNSFSKSNCRPESTFMGLSGPSSSESFCNNDTKHYTGETAQWECGVCTLLNPVSIYFYFS